MAEVESTLNNLASREDGPAVSAPSARTGKREKPLYAPVCDDMDSLITVVEAVSPNDDCRRVEALESEVAELKVRLDSLLAHESNRDGRNYVLAWWDLAALRKGMAAGAGRCGWLDAAGRLVAVKEKSVTHLRNPASALCRVSGCAGGAM